MWVKARRLSGKREHWHDDPLAMHEARHNDVGARRNCCASGYEALLILKKSPATVAGPAMSVRGEGFPSRCA
jgi:hypothetical protein